ncbi:hypothetical protein CR513_20574, partial [Mucuna pruriens]
MKAISRMIPLWLWEKNLVLINVLRMTFEEKEMQKISYPSTVRNLMYAQVCTHLDIAYITRMLGRYLSNSGLDNQMGHAILIEHERLYAQSKHIDIKFLVVKERVQSEQLSRKHIETNSMVVYLLTKELPPKMFHEHIACIGDGFHQRFSFGSNNKSYKLKIQ